VAGSTLEGEESALLDAWPRLLAADAQLLMVLAPRHPSGSSTWLHCLRDRAFRGRGGRIGGRDRAPGPLSPAQSCCWIQSASASIYSLPACVCGGSVAERADTIRGAANWRFPL